MNTEKKEKKKEEKNRIFTPTAQTQTQTYTPTAQTQIQAFTPTAQTQIQTYTPNAQTQIQAFTTAKHRPDVALTYLPPDLILTRSCFCCCQECLSMLINTFIDTSCALAIDDTFICTIHYTTLYICPLN